MSEQTIEQQIRSENPEFVISEDRIVRTISPENEPELYEEMIADRVALAIVRKERNDIEEADKALRKQIRDALQDLDSAGDALLGGGTLSTAVQRQILGRVCRIVAGMIRVLIRRGIVEDS